MIKQAEPAQALRIPLQPLPSKAFWKVTSSTKCGRAPSSWSLRASMILVPWWLWSKSRDATAAMTR